MKRTGKIRFFFCAYVCKTERHIGRWSVVQIFDLGNGEPLPTEIRYARACRGRYHLPETSCDKRMSHRVVHKNLQITVGNDPECHSAVLRQTLRRFAVSMPQAACPDCKKQTPHRMQTLSDILQRRLSI